MVTGWPGHLLAAAGSGLPPGGGIGRRAAQQLARHELSRPIYHQGKPLTQQLLDGLGRLLNAASGAVPGGWWALVALAVALVLVVAGTAAWIGPVGRARPGGTGALAPRAQLTAAEHRSRYQHLATAGDQAGAIIECLRAIAAELTERGVLAPRPGRTADELADEAGGALPEQASELRVAARLFDDVRYGDRAGTSAGYQRMRDLDLRISR